MLNIIYASINRKAFIDYLKFYINIIKNIARVTTSSRYIRILVLYKLNSKISNINAYRNPLWR